jgi:hypothetical protein
MQNEHHETLKKLGKGVNIMIKTNNDLQQKIHAITDQRNKYKDKAERMERDHEYDWLKNLLGYALSFTGGAVFDQTILPKIKDFLLSLIAEYGKTSWDPANTTQPVVKIQPDIYYTHTE